MNKSQNHVILTTTTTMVVVVVDGGWWMVDGGDDDGDDISEFFKSRDIDTDACPMPGLEGAWFRPD